MRIHQTIARDLGIAILTGTYKPGDALIGEIECAGQLGVSRSAYREAVRILTAKGLLHSRPKTGTHVTPRAQWSLLDPEVLGWMFSSEPDPRFVQGLFELRGIIEPAAARLAAMRRSTAQLEALGAALDDMGRHGLAVEEGQLADQRFHRLVLEATHNEPLIALASSVGAAVRLTTHFKQREHPLPRDPLPDHAAVHQAIAEQDEAGAWQAMSNLLTLALDDVGAEFATQKPGDAVTGAPPAG